MPMFVSDYHELQASLCVLQVWLLIRLECTYLTIMLCTSSVNICSLSYCFNLDYFFLLRWTTLASKSAFFPVHNTIQSKLDCWMCKLVAQNSWSQYSWSYLTRKGHSISSALLCLFAGILFDPKNVMFWVNLYAGKNYLGPKDPIYIQIYLTIWFRSTKIWYHQKV